IAGMGAARRNICGSFDRAGGACRKGGGANGGDGVARTFLQHGAQYGRGSVGCISHVVRDAPRVCGRGDCPGGTRDHRGGHSRGYTCNDVPISRHRTHSCSFTEVCCDGLTKPRPHNSSRARRKSRLSERRKRNLLLFLFPEEAAQGSSGGAGSTTRASSRSCASIAQAPCHAAKIRQENGSRRCPGKSEGYAAAL